MAVYDGTLVDKVSAEAKANQVDWARLVLTFFGAFFYSVGWTAAKVLNGLQRVGRALSWTIAAVRLGWRDGRRTIATART